MMAGIGAQDTQPEHAVRRYLHAAGLRFRLQDRNLPGRPDLVFPARKTVVFVHGCFWHRHAGCRFATTPATRPAFWQRKFSSNVDRDRRVAESLGSMGWRVLVVWECEIRNELALDRLFWRIVSL
jgi:DNA mismatch endonuclease (patch repair protein)